MQIMFQHPETALNPYFNIYRSLSEPMHIQGMVKNPVQEKEMVLRLLEQVGLHEEHLSRYPHELSGGQIQRVVLARILSLQPKFIVADEPTSMLDVSVQAQVLQIFRGIQQKFGIAYLFISHDLEVVRQMSHDLAVMYQGRIVEKGPTEKVYQRPLHPYTMLLVSAFASLNNGQLVPPHSKAAFREGNGCSYAPFCPLAGAKCSRTPKLKEVSNQHSVACWQV